MVLKPQCHRARHERDGGKMLAQAVMQILTEAALFAVTDGGVFPFQSAGALFQDGLSFFLVGDVENNRDRRLGFALAVAQWRRAHADPQKRAVLTTITLFELIRLGFSDDSAKKAPAFGDVAGMCDMHNGFAEDFTLLVAKHRTEFLVRERDAAR